MPAKIINYLVLTVSTHDGFVCFEIRNTENWVEIPTAIVHP